MSTVDSTPRGLEAEALRIGAPLAAILATLADEEEATIVISLSKVRGIVVQAVGDDPRNLSAATSDSNLIDALCICAGRLRQCKDVR